MRRRPGLRVRSVLGREYLIVTVTMIVLLAVFFNPIVRHGGTFSTVSAIQTNSNPWASLEPGRHVEFPPQGDQGDYVHPGQVFLDQSLKRYGQIPLWNPLAFGGHPYLATEASGVAYPPRLALAWLFSPSWAHDLFIIIHLLIAGLAMFALMKSFGVRFAGALLAAVSWAFSSYAFGWIMLELYAVLGALLPLVILCIRRWHDRRSWRWLLCGSLLLGVMFLGTGKELALLSFYLAFGYAAALALCRLVASWRDLRWTGRFALAAAPIVLIGAALAVAAVNLLPLLELAGESQRAAGAPYDLLKTLVVPPSVLLRSFVPPVTPLTVPNLLSQQVFVGTATAILAVVGLFVRRPGSGLARALLIVVFLYVAGTPVTWVAYYYVPALKGLNGYGRSLFLWDFGLALLGGIGLDALLRAHKAGRLSFREQAGDEEGSSPPDDRLPVERYFVGARLKKVLPAVLAAACILASTGQLLVYGRHANPPFQPRQARYLFPSTPAIDEARALVGTPIPTGRVMPVGRAGALPPLLGMSAMAVDLPSVGGYEPIVPGRVSALLRALSLAETPTSALTTWNGTFYTYFLIELLRTDLLARIGVAAILAPPGTGAIDGWQPEALAAKGLRQAYSGSDGEVFEVTDHAPRAFVVHDTVGAGSEAQALDLFLSPSFNVHQEVILEGRPAKSPPTDGRAPTGPTPAVRWLADTPNNVRLSVTSAEPGWLVLMDNWDEGWRAKVNGRGTPVARANFGFRAVPIPAGESNVDFSYLPREVVAGASISGFSSLSIMAVLVIGPVRRRRRTARASAR